MVHILAVILLCASALAQAPPLKFSTPVDPVYEPPPPMTREVLRNQLALKPEQGKALFAILDAHKAEIDKIMHGSGTPPDKLVKLNELHISDAGQIKGILDDGQYRRLLRIEQKYEGLEVAHIERLKRSPPPSPVITLPPPTIITVPVKKK